MSNVKSCVGLRSVSCCFCFSKGQSPNGPGTPRHDRRRSQHSDLTGRCGKKSIRRTVQTCVLGGRKDACLKSPSRSTRDGWLGSNTGFEAAGDLHWLVAAQRDACSPVSDNFLSSCALCFRTEPSCGSTDAFSRKSFRTRKTRTALRLLGGTTSTKTP